MGLIATPVAADQSYLAVWQERTPIVFIDRSPSGIVADTFVEDDFGGAVVATLHLIDHGHRRVAFIGDDPSVWTTRRRLAGYKDALRSSGIDIDQDFILTGNWTVDNTMPALEALFGRRRAPSALFSSNARCSASVIPALQALGRVGIALVGFGDFPLANALTPALTVIDQDPHQLGLLAAERVFARIDTPGRRLRRKTILPVRLIPRGSGELPPPVDGR
jgi:LacI family transcriptional regulator